MKNQKKGSHNYSWLDWFLLLFVQHQISQSLVTIVPSCLHLSGKVYHTCSCRTARFLSKQSLFMVRARRM